MTREKGMRISEKNARRMSVFVCALIGALSFVFLYGLDSLHVTFDWWILNGYVEEDIIQHYTGWMAFRDSPWAFPLGLARNLGWPSGVVISFTDSLPLVSLFFKCFSRILPETFQFFGWYTLACFVLQGVAAGLLAGLFTKHPWETWGITGLFTFSPVLIERAFRHTALASQWLILFALYYYFREKKTGKFPWGFLLLNFLCVGIHPYFLPMVWGILAAWTLESLWRRRKSRGHELEINGRSLKGNAGWGKILLFFLGNLGVTGLSGWALGLFGSGVSGASSGFGYYSMNLNALVNPSSLGMEGWSALLPTLSQTGGNYDGFNYLGLGVLLAAGAGVPGKALALIKERKLWSFCKEYAGLLVFLLFCCLFALSNRVTFGEREIFHIPLPEAVERLCSVFRASGRMFYPVYEMLFLAAGVFAVRLPAYFSVRGNAGKLGKTTVRHSREEIARPDVPGKEGKHTEMWGNRLGAAALALLLGLQLYDLSPAIAWKRASIDASRMEAGSYNPALYESRDWAQALAAYGRVEILNYHHDYNLAAFLMKHHVQSNILPANRGDFTEAKKRCESMILQLYEGKPMEDGVLYITDNPVLASQLLWNLSEEVSAYDLGDYMGFGRKQEGVAAKAAVSGGEKGTYTSIPADSPDWLYMRGAGENEIVLPYTVILERELNGAEALGMGEETVKIVGYEVYSNEYIQDYVYVACEEGVDISAFKDGKAVRMVTGKGESR